MHFQRENKPESKPVALKRWTYWESVYSGVTWLRYIHYQKWQEVQLERVVPKYKEPVILLISEFPKAPNTVPNIESVLRDSWMYGCMDAKPELACSAWINIATISKNLKSLLSIKELLSIMLRQSCAHQYIEIQTSLICMSVPDLLEESAASK